jgi:hypothetical protein
MKRKISEKLLRDLDSHVADIGRFGHDGEKEVCHNSYMDCGGVRVRVGYMEGCVLDRIYYPNDFSYREAEELLEDIRDYLENQRKIQRNLGNLNENKFEGIDQEYIESELKLRCGNEKI